MARKPGPELLDLHPADRARDHELLDLGGPLEDVGTLQPHRLLGTDTEHGVLLGDLLKVVE